MAKMAEVKAAVDAYKEEINRDFDAFGTLVGQKLNELQSTRDNGDDAAGDAVIADLKQAQDDFKAKIQGKTDALSPQVVASAGAAQDPLPAAPEQETIPSSVMDTIEAGQNPRLGGTLQEQPGKDSIDTSNIGNDTVDVSAKSGLDTVEPGKGDETLPSGDLMNLGGTNTGADTISQ